jgi:hypothetical protein
LTAPLRRPLIRRLLLVAFALGFLGILRPESATASTIRWEYDLLVDGTATACLNPIGGICTGGLQSITIPVGTPMVVDVSFNTDQPNQCGSDPYAGLYMIGGTVDFLGYRYGVSGGLEINSSGFFGCSGRPTFELGGVRLLSPFTGEQIAPNGTEIEWTGSFGALFLEIPPTSWLGNAWPVGLPAETSPFGGYSFTIGADPRLHIESTELLAVPEPSSMVLLGSGGLVASMRRRKSQRRDPKSI